MEVNFTFTNSLQVCILNQIFLVFDRFLVYYETSRFISVLTPLKKMCEGKNKK